MAIRIISNPPNVGDWARITQDAQHVENFVNDTVPADLALPGGGTRPNIAKWLADADTRLDGFEAARDATISAKDEVFDLIASGNAIPYATKALLLADLTPADKMVGWVYGDATATNNGYYVKSGATGTGSWVAAVDRVAAEAVARAAADALMAAQPLTQQKIAFFSSDDYALSGWYSVYVDEDSRIVEGVTDDDDHSVWIIDRWIVGGPDGDLIATQNLGGQTIAYLDPADFALSEWASAYLDEDFRLVGGVRLASEEVSPTEPPAVLPYELQWATYTETVSGNSQVFVENRSTGRRMRVSSLGSNETNPRVLPGEYVAWQSDRAGGARNGLYYARLDDFIERPLLAKRAIACWGDSFTDQGYPAMLQTKTGWDCYEFGFSSHTSSAIVARMGAAPAYYAPVGGSIPASGSVALTPSTPGPAQTAAGGLRNIVCTFAGVPGTFTYDPSAGTSFTRTSSGDAVAVSAPAAIVCPPITTAGAGVEVPDFREMVQILEMGRNNPNSIERILSDLAAAIAYLTPYTKRFVIWPVFNSNSEILGSSGYGAIMELNKQIKASWPENYIEIGGVDLRKYIVNQYNPSLPQDVTDFANDVPPASLRADFLHPNSAGYSLCADFIKLFLDSKEWF